jgi:hypothetical protein
MGQTFRIPVRGDLEAKLRIARQKAASRGVTMSGDTRSGQFSGLISGTYEISGGVAIVTITAKPFFVSWETIEQQLRGFLGG